MKRAVKIVLVITTRDRQTDGQVEQEVDFAVDVAVDQLQRNLKAEVYARFEVKRVC